jgi:hypothetical protein
MISFRKRWSIHDRYCYYSGDNAWLRTSNACWDTIRSIWQARYRLSSNGIRGEVQHSHTAQQSVPDNHRDNALGVLRQASRKQFSTPQPFSGWTASPSLPQRRSMQTVGRFITKDKTVWLQSLKKNIPQFGVKIAINKGTYLLITLKAPIS